jgi:hypothetical protein
MNEIDFLPDQYRQKHAYRHEKPWQIMVVTLFLGLVVIVTISQHVHSRMVEKELAELAPAYETALNQQQQLAGVQKQLKQMECEAALITYLHHPWPRSQLLSALLSSLPEEITLQQLQISCETGRSSVPAGNQAATVSEISPEQLKSMPPAERDLHYLKNQFHGKQTVVTLIGSTSDSAALHRFLDEILLNSLFYKAELGSVTSAGDRPEAAIQFNAKVFVKPPYSENYVY